MAKKRKVGRDVRVGIIYECPNSDCPVIEVTIRYGRGKSAIQEVFR